MDEKDEQEQECRPSRSSLNTELAAQYELAQEQQRLDEETEAAAQGLRRSCRQRGADTEEGGCSEGVSVECQAWKETTLIARGEIVVPRLRIRQRGTQEQTAGEVQIMATVVEAVKGCRTSGQKAREKGRQRTREMSAGKKKKSKGQPQDGVQSDRGQGVKGTGEPEGARGREAQGHRLEYVQ